MPTLTFPRRVAAAACLAASLGLAGLAPAARAEPLSSPLPQHAWISQPLRPEEPSNYFTNLKNGDRIETPFLLKFGLTSRLGISPIVQPVPKTGHHHLLVNRELPLDFTKPLPFNDQYIHFGKGQMETVLTLPPGTYTLRLLLADHKHIPYFINSKPMTITVARKNDGVDPQSLVKPGVELLAPRDGETLKPPFRVQFHVSGFNVGPPAIKEPRTGHFRLVAERAGGAAPERVEFTGGHTEAWLAPPPGDYRFKVEFVSNADGAEVLASSSPLAVKVVR